MIFSEAGRMPELQSLSRSTYDKIGKQVQQSGILFYWQKLFAGLIVNIICHDACLFNPEMTGVGRLFGQCVFARGFAKRFASLSDVEQIVGDLKQQTELRDRKSVV